MTEEVTQDAATLNLLMNREVDKRVILALHRALFPVGNGWREQELSAAYDCNTPGRIRELVVNMMIEAIMMDGSLMHQIRSKIGESLQRY